MPLAAASGSGRNRSALTPRLRRRRRSRRRRLPHRHRHHPTSISPLRPPTIDLLKLLLLGSMQKGRCPSVCVFLASAILRTFVFVSIRQSEVRTGSQLPGRRMNELASKHPIPLPRSSAASLSTNDDPERKANPNARASTEFLVSARMAAWHGRHTVNK